MRGASTIHTGSVLGGHFLVAAEPPDAGIPRLDSPHAVARLAHDRRTGDIVLIEATATVVPPAVALDILPRLWPRNQALVTLHGHGHDAASGAAWICREAARGTLLDVKTQRAVPDAARLAVALLEALHVLHGHGVVNWQPLTGLVVGADGRQRLLPVISWESYGGFTAYASAGLGVGTAPELLGNALALATPASHVFAVGALLYRLIEGREHLGYRSPWELTRQREGAPMRPMEAPGVTPALSATLAKALARDAAERWPDAAKFAQALRQAVAS